MTTFCSKSRWSCLWSKNFKPMTLKIDDLVLGFQDGWPLLSVLKIYDLYILGSKNRWCSEIDDPIKSF